MPQIDEHTKVGYDFRNQNGAGIWLPPNIPGAQNNLKRINPYLATAAQLYPVGAIGFLDQRKFAYAYCSGALAGWARLVIDSNYIPYASGHTDEDGFEGQIYAAAAAAAVIVDIEDTTARAVNYYAGSYLTLFNADGVRTTTIRIAANDLGNGSTHTRLYLDDGLPWAVVEHDWCNAYRSPYSNVTEHAGANSGFETFVGLSLCAVTATYYSWLQIAGSAWIAQSAAATIPGYAVNNIDAWAWEDGTCRFTPATDDTLQYIGYKLGMAVNGYGDTYIMLRMG